MRRYWVFSAFCLCAILFATHFTSADSALRVNQAKSRALLFAERTEIALAIENPSAKAIGAQIKLELLDTNNVVCARSERRESLAAGLHIAEFTLSLKQFDKQEGEALLWYRVRYQIETAATPVTGIIALAEITPDMFEIRTAIPYAAVGGTRYQTQVIAVHPITSRPIAGVKITGKLEIDDSDGDESKGGLQASGITNEEGYTRLEFQLPERLQEGFFEVEFTGEYKGLVQQTVGSGQAVNEKQIIVNSDKVIYQPGQTLHVRALLLGAQRRALAGEAMILKITDETGLVVYRATVKTSRFGIASADWQIPANLRLGEYQIQFSRESDDEYAWHSSMGVRISRYELPNFTVQAKVDRSYYLPNQNAEVEVRGEYLFGQALKRGRVKVVRETGRNWNFREQKWEIEEEDKQEGELDSQGRFVARLNLGKAQKELEENDYQQFQNLAFTAYITDLTTNRTEQRRFDVRLSKTPIHIYLISSRPQSTDFPMEFYLSTFYADGSPASCQVQIREINSGKEEAGSYGKTLRTVRTNRYGLAKVENLFISDLNADHTRTEVTLVARDDKGLSGQREESLMFREEARIRIKTDKLLYRAGEPISLQIAAGKEIALLFIEVTDQSSLPSLQPLFSQAVKPINGRALLTIPYQNNFKGELGISAYSNYGHEIGEYEYPSDAREVIYPQADELKIELAMSQNQYRPGEEASAEVEVKANGGGAESALGITVFDRAVEERVRTDNESGRSNSYFDSYFGSFGFSEQIAGISRRSLNQLDLSRPLPKDLLLVADALLRSDRLMRRNLMSKHHIRDYQAAYKQAINAQLFPVLSALGTRYKKTFTYPTNGAELRRLLSDFGLDFDALRDPWGTPYLAHFFIRNDERRLQLISASIDKKMDTKDDFVATSMSWKYFKATGDLVTLALKNHHQRSGQYIRDIQTLKAQLRREGVELAALRDPWGNAYRVEFGIVGNRYFVAFHSGGANRQFKSGGDDFTVWTSWIDYTTELRAKLEKALSQYHERTKNFPQNDRELAAALEGFDKKSLRDGWGRPLYATYKTESQYGDRVRIYSYARYPQQSQQRTEITPVTRQLKSVTIRSSGADGKEGTFDDFDVAKYSRMISEQAIENGKPELKKIGLREPPVLPDGKGAISGLVRDPLGAVIAGAKVKATNKVSTIEYETTTDDEGRYAFTNLPSGFYDLHFEMAGFMKAVISEVTVTSGSVTGVDVELGIGTTDQMVTVTGTAETVQTERSDSLVEVRKVQELPMAAGKKESRNRLQPGVSMDGGQVVEATATPRLRDYFPETLFWQPEIVTDAQGRTQVKFKLADNITTWKLAAIASTTDGRVAVTEREVRAFQPFFAELDPPPILTSGDRLSLPVVLRNYLDKPQTIRLQLKSEPWFEMLGAAEMRSAIAAGEARRETFDIRATAAVKDGKQRVTAIGSEASDAIEKTVSVHPDGEEISQTANQIFGATARLELHVPADAIKETATAELKIYPNLMAHVFESIEAIMRRPYGCGEQTISAAYPSLLALRHCRQRGDASSPVCLKAQRYVQQGYEKLLGYRTADGGFTYWGGGSSDFALTAYALKFFSDAGEFIAVDEAVVNAARDWLIKYQESDGRWVAQSWQRTEDKRRSALLTAYVAQVFAALLKKGVPEIGKETAKAEGAKAQARNDRRRLADATKRALDHLSPRLAEIDEPYLMAAYALAALDADEQARAEKALQRLRLLVRDEGGAAYWSLETNTPFYGWGLAGRVEATALVVRALAKEQTAKLRNRESADAPAGKDAELINRGLLFLLHQKDRYGVWYSTQATVNVLETLASILSQRDAETGGSDNQKAAGNRAEILINGKAVDSVTLPPANQLASPLRIDISKHLLSGKNSVEIRRPANAPQATAQIVATHYENWQANGAKEQNSALRLAVNFDKREARTGEAIRCTVEAERLAFRGYGMILAEIGLPPGAEVDRASLDLAMKNSHWQINQYDLLPDRVVVYLWPSAGGLQFEFQFRQRFAIDAKNASSVLYDYYNPEARSVIAPVRFRVL